MKLARIGAPGQERPAAIGPDGKVRDISGYVADIDGDLFTSAAWSDLKSADLSKFPVVEPGRFGCCVARVGKIVCVGLNYADHAKEGGFEVPREPLTFLKATSALSGPNDPITMPRGSQKLDWEVELGVVIGRRAQYVDEEQALEHVAGYCVFNDVSERFFQLESGGQWSKGKSFDSFGPCGPYLVTADEIADPQDLTLRLAVNGIVRQEASTSDMIFSVRHLVAYLSNFMTLHPGDIIATGTPPGVGLGLQPPSYLRSGDVISVEIQGLGSQTQIVVSYGTE